MTPDFGAQVLHRILVSRYEDSPWPATEIETTPEAITGAIIGRLGPASSLWQQPATLADVICVYGDTALHREEMPVVCFDDPALSFLLTLEDGQPAVRAYADRRVIGTHRPAADRRALAAFVEGVLTAAQRTHSRFSTR